jgi:hypothetical protein
MATMPSRVETAPRALASILPQVSRLWLFLDRFDTVPAYARDDRIRVVRSQDAGDLRANGKLLGLALEEEPCTFFPVDDDVEYPRDFCRTLEARLDHYSSPVGVGVHAAILHPPIASYARDWTVLHRRAAQREERQVDLLGTDSLAVHSSTLRIDVRDWPDVNMVDLRFALAARRQSLPLVTIPRRAYWLQALDENQPDSIWMGVVRDDSRQTELARELDALPKPQLPTRRRRRLSLRSA